MHTREKELKRIKFVFGLNGILKKHEKTKRCHFKYFVCTSKIYPKATLHRKHKLKKQRKFHSLSI